MASRAFPALAQTDMCALHTAAFGVLEAGPGFLFANCVTSASTVAPARRTASFVVNEKCQSCMGK